MQKQNVVMRCTGYLSPGKARQFIHENGVVLPSIALFVIWLVLSITDKYLVNKLRQ